MEAKFVIPGEPQTKGRPRFTNMGKYVKTYTPGETVLYENLVKLSYIEQCKDIRLEGAISATITSIFSIPKSVSKKKRKEMLDGTIKHTKSKDLDNIAKTVLDSINGIAYDDDRQICRLYVEKIYGEIPRVEVTLKEI